MKLLVAVCFALGCASASHAPPAPQTPLAPRGPDIPHLFVPGSEYEVRDDGHTYHAEIPFRYTNRTSDTLVFTGCNLPPRPLLEWWTGTEWHYAYDQIEFGCRDSPFVIPPGTVIEDTLRLRVSRDSIRPDGRQVMPYWVASRTVGEYRLTWPLRSQAPIGVDRRRHGGPLRPIAERVSNTFRLRLRRAAAPQN
jgi:hypothetical protein